MKLMLELSGDEEEVRKFQEVLYALSDTKAFEWVRVDSTGYMED